MNQTHSGETRNSTAPASVPLPKGWTKRWRGRCTNTRFGYRAVNNWGDGDLPAPFAEGDIVRLDAPYPTDRDDGYNRLRGMGPGFFVVTYCCSIDEGDGWYARVWDGESDHGSDRLHIYYEERCANGPSMNYMEPFTLIDTADPDGLVVRERLIADGWKFADRWKVCPACGSITRSELATTQTHQSDGPSDG